MWDLSIKAKSYVVIILMIGCFGLLYPKILHPMLLHILGLRSSDSLQQEFVHPRDRHMLIKNAPKPPHPAHHGGRVMSENQGQSGRGGVMTMVLPVYAVGIVFYLLYTLVKVFGGSKENKKTKRESLLKNYYRDFHYDPNAGDFKMNYNHNDKNGLSAEEVTKDISYRFRPEGDIYDTARTLPHDLEHLLQKVDERNINENEMHQLKIRLEETEAQLTKILMAMEKLEVSPRRENVLGKEEESNILDITGQAEETFEDCEESQGVADNDTAVIQRRMTNKVRLST